MPSANQVFKVLMCKILANNRWEFLSTTTINPNHLFHFELRIILSNTHCLPFHLSLPPFLRQIPFTILSLSFDPIPPRRFTLFALKPFLKSPNHFLLFVLIALKTIHHFRSCSKIQNQFKIACFSLSVLPNTPIWYVSFFLFWVFFFLSLMEKNNNFFDVLGLGFFHEQQLMVMGL